MPESSNTNHVVFAIGRFNPPHRGHLKLINHVIDHAARHGADHAVYATQTHDDKKNPLTYHEKVNFMKTQFPHANIDHTPEIKTPIDALKHLGKKYSHVTMMVGEDRHREFSNFVHHYNNNVYHIPNLEVVSAGMRDPDSDGVEGMSASKMREHAKYNRFQEFKKALPSTDRARELFKATRRGLKMESNNAVFVVGGPGSGKDILIRTVLNDSKLNELSLDKLFHSISNKQDIKAVNNREPLIINGNADNAEKVFVTKTVLEALGYKTAMVYVYTTNEASKERNDMRIAHGSKTHDELIREEKYLTSIGNISGFHTAFEAFVIFNNSHDLRKLDEDKRAEVTGWLTELQDLLESHFKKKVEPEGPETYHCVYCGKEVGDQGRAGCCGEAGHTETRAESEKRWGGIDESIEELFAEDLDSDTKPASKFSDFKNSNKRVKANSEKESVPVQRPAKPIITNPTKTASEAVEVPQASIIKPIKGKKRGKTKLTVPPGTEFDPRMGDGMNATATLSLEATVSQTCPKCHGKGKVYDLGRLAPGKLAYKPCPTCKGTGRVHRKAMDVKEQINTEQSGDL